MDGLFYRHASEVTALFLLALLLTAGAVLFTTTKAMAVTTAAFLVEVGDFCCFFLCAFHF